VKQNAAEMGVEAVKKERKWAYKIGHLICNGRKTVAFDDSLSGNCCALIARK
jgi:hypothetical protein